MAARLLRAQPKLDLAIIEPSEDHFYQPIWTLVGAGLFPKSGSRRKQAEIIPRGAHWIHDSVQDIEPATNTVITRSGERIRYDQLVVALGIQLDWHKIDGLTQALGQDGVCSNYDYQTVDSTWRFLKDFSGGNALFTFPSTPVKCAGAPQKIMYLADDWLRKRGVRERTRVVYASATPSIFGVAYYVVPPQSAHDVVKRSELASQEGWVEVHKHTLQHVRFANVFALGDNASLPTSRTGAALQHVPAESLWASGHVLERHAARSRLTTELGTCRVGFQCVWRSCSLRRGRLARMARLSARHVSSPPRQVAAG